MIAPSVWPNWLDQVWAKSPATGKSIGETLAEHTWNVLCRVADLARLRPGLPSYLRLPRFWQLLFWVAFLHDWGKAAVGFQGAVRGGPRWRHRHEVLSLAFLNWVSGMLEEEEASWLAAAIGTHHKDISELQESYPSGLEPEDDPLVELVGELREEAVEGLWLWLSEAAEQWIQALGLGVMSLNCPPKNEALTQVFDGGSDSIHKWLRRCDRLVESMERSDTISLRICTLLLRGYLIQSDHVASAHVGSLESPSLDQQRILEATKVRPETLYEHQRKAAQASGSALLIAPTGSGKTEAALLWAAQQTQMRGTIPRLFYTLPYQASMNAMYDRLRGVFPDRVGLLHGRSTLALYRRLMDQEHTPAEARIVARQLRNIAQLNVPPVRVFSPYQMLKATYQLKGYEAMLADYAQGAFIFDEIHAYEPGRLAMILETVRYLRENLGCLFLVMTATLPGPVRHHLEEVLDGLSVISASADLFRSFTRHQVYLCSGELLSESGLAAIVKAFTDGRSVLVTCNTVVRAQKAYHELQARLSDVPAHRIILVHGRFNGRDRLTKERNILAAVSLGSTRQEPVLVVSTQVVEVSLNIDLDTLFSEPAPLEALVQRFGRVNRKRRLAVAPVHVFTEPTDGQGIYDPLLLQATLHILQTQAQLRPIDEGALQGWLDAIYQGPFLAKWEKEYSETAKEFRRACLDSLRPFSSNSQLEGEFDDLFDGLEILPLALKKGYDYLKEERPIEATELLVPISLGRWHGLRRSKRIVSPPGEWPPVIDAPYSQELGLEFPGPS